MYIWAGSLWPDYLNDWFCHLSTSSSRAYLAIPSAKFTVLESLCAINMGALGSASQINQNLCMQPARAYQRCTNHHRRLTGSRCFATLRAIAVPNAERKCKGMQFYLRNAG